MLWIHSGEQVLVPVGAPLVRYQGKIVSDYTEEVQQDLSPDPATLEILRDLCKRFGMVRASGIGPVTPSEWHRAVHGHPLRFGCCRVTPPAR